MSERKDGTPAQVTLGWLLAQRTWIVPISETTKFHRVGRNLGAVYLEFTADDLTEIGTEVSKIMVQGDRIPTSRRK
jgi:aryl-alcohol dehydrogenase-like predicted oxidoreductase